MLESRRVEVRIDKKFEIDREKFSFKTDENGEFQAAYIFTHKTQKIEKRAWYAMLEEKNSPLTMKVNGEKNSYYFVDVSKEGETRFDFTLTDLPPGEHIVYIISEKMKENHESDLHPRIAFSVNYFSLKVDHSKPQKAEEQLKIVEKIGESDKGEMISLHLYEDRQLSTVVSAVSNKKYYLSINNNSEYEIKGRLKFVADYSTEDLDQIRIPANTKGLLPVNLENHKAKESIRFILLGKPTEKIDASFPARISMFSERIPYVRG